MAHFYTPLSESIRASYGAVARIADIVIVPGGLRCFAPFKGLCPLRRSAAIPITPQRYFLPAGHAKHGATPQGVFDWAREQPVWGLGAPQQAHRDVQKDIPMPCLPTFH